MNIRPASVSARAARSLPSLTGAGLQVDDLMGMQNANLHNLPEVSSSSVAPPEAPLTRPLQNYAMKYCAYLLAELARSHSAGADSLASSVQTSTTLSPGLSSRSSLRTTRAGSWATSSPRCACSTRSGLHARSENWGREGKLTRLLSGAGTRSPLMSRTDTLRPFQY